MSLPNNWLQALNILISLYIYKFHEFNIGQEQGLWFSDLYGKISPDLQVSSPTQRLLFYLFWNTSVGQIADSEKTRGGAF